MDEGQSRNNQQYFTNEGYNTASVIKMRLDTTPVLEEIEFYLRGGRQVAEVVDNEVIVKKIKFADPKANEEGINEIMAFVKSAVNPSAVQGNFDDVEYGNYLYHYKKKFGNIIILNMYKWNIKQEEIEGIISKVMSLVIPFISRLKNDGERKSYGNSMQTSESTVVQGNKGFGLFSGNKN